MNVEDIELIDYELRSLFKELMALDIYWDLHIAKLVREMKFAEVAGPRVIN